VDDREMDIRYLEITMKNEELVRQWMLDKLGSRADAIRGISGQRGSNEEAQATAQVVPQNS